MTPHRVAVRTTVRVVDPLVLRTADALLEYSADAPLEVRATFSDAAAEVTWRWGRDVLSAAVRSGPSGMGDVRMWTAGGEVMVRLDSPAASLTGNTRCVLALPLLAVLDFLGRSARVVPFGREAEYLDLDAGIAALLDAGS